MSSIDKRIVEMQFDNKQFENGIKTSTKSLDNLKKSLELEGSSKGLSNLQKTVNAFTLEGIARGIDSISNKFSALSIIGITTLVNLTNSAINAGKTFVSALTIDPIKTGLEEYETKMNSIQTILTNTASKGTTLSDVNKALEELNKYSDLTIYNFAEMTRNIGTFTAAGVDLKTSVESIKGIANLAAGSGSSSLQASTAMYQLSQAIASGSVKLMDWNSVVNAGMGGELFQKALEKTAVQLGHGRNMAVSFRESLESGWITTEVLTKTLQKFANDPSLILAATQVKTFTQLVNTMRESVQSGWAQTWEIIIGNKDEAANFFTGLNDGFNSMAGASADARNEMLSYWKANEGRTMLLQGISNVLIGISELLKPIEDAFREIFPPMTGERLVEITKAFRDLTANFKIGAETASNIKSTFKGLFAVLDVGVKAFKLLSTVVGLVIKALIPGVNVLTSITAVIGNFLVYLNNAISSSNVITIALEKIGVTINYVANTIIKGLSTLGPAFNNIQGVLLALGACLKDVLSKGLESLSPIINKLQMIVLSLGKTFREMFTGTTVFAATLTDANDAFSSTTSQSDKLGFSFTKLKDIISSIISVISKVTKVIKNVLAPVFDSIKKKFDEFSMQDLGALLAGGGFLILARTLSKVGNIADSVSGVLDQVGNTLKAFQLRVKAQALMSIAIALGILAAALFTLSFIKMEDLAKSLATLTIVLVELIGALILINKYVKDVTKITTQMIALGIGMLLLANSVKVLASIDGGRLIQGVTAIAALMGVVAAFIKITKGGDLKASAGGLSSFAIGITILSGALFILGKIDTGRLIQGVTAISALMGVIALFINITKTGDLSASAGGLIGFSIGITILSGALSILGKIDTSKLKQGIAALGTLMLMLTMFINLTRGGSLVKGAGGLIAFSTGIMILSGALAILGKMDTGRLVQGIVAISALMGVIAGFVNLTRGGNLAASAGGLIGFSIGITILTKALSNLSNIDTNKLTQGTLAIASLVAVIGIFINVTKGGDLAASAAGLIGFSIGIVILSKAVSILASIDSNKIIQGATSMAVLMVSIAAFTQLTKGGDLAASSAGLIAFSAGIAILSVAMVAISRLDTGKIIAIGASISVLLLSIMAFTNLTAGGDLVISAAGLAIFSGAIMLLAKVITTLGSTNIQTLIIGISSMAVTLAILGLTSAVLAPLTPIIIALSAAVTLFGVGCLAVGAGILAFSNGLNILATTGQAGSAILVSTVRGMIDLIPYMLQQIGNGLVEFARVITSRATTIAGAFGALIEAMIDRITTLTPNIIRSVVVMLSTILDTLIQYVPNMVDAGMKLILGFLKGISNHTQEITAVSIKIVVEFINGVASMLPQIIQAGFNLIISFINGLADAIEKNAPLLMDAIGNLAESIISAAGDVLTGSFDIGVNVVKGMINGIRSYISHAAETAASLGTSVIESARRVLGIHSPSTMFKEIGENIVKGMTKGIDNNSNKAVDASTNMSKDVTKASSNVVKTSNQSAKEAFDKAVEWIDERKYYNQLSLSEELKAWQDLQNKYIAGTEERKRADKEVYRLKQELYKADYDAAVKHIDNKKYYNQMSLQEELETWVDIQNKYQEGTQEREKADREVYRLQNERNQEIISGRHKTFEAEVKEIDDRKYYNQMSLQEELDAWKKIQGGYIALAEDREKVNREVYRVEQEINKAKEDLAKKTLQIEEDTNEKRKNLEDEYYVKTQEINDKVTRGVEELNKKYDDAVKSRSESLYNSYGLFDKVDTSKNVSGDQLIRNLQGQVNTFETWKKNINSLSAKGIDQDLLKELKDMGPKSAAQIQALNNLSSDKLDTYVSLWKTKHKDAKNQAITELESMRLDTLSQIEQLRKDSAAELDQYIFDWYKRLDVINTNSTKQLESLQSDFDKTMKVVRTNSETEIGIMSVNVQTSVSDMRKNTEGEVTTLADNIKKIISNTDWYSVGVSIIDGITLGITENKQKLVQKVSETAKAVLDTAKSVLGINSPSKEFYKIGMYTNQGFANGLDNFSNLILSSAKGVGETAISSLQWAISNISDIVNNNMDSSPVIRPVLDLGGVTTGIGTINSMFSRTQGLAVGGVVDKASYTSSTMSSNSKISQNGSNKSSSVETNATPTPIYVTVVSELDGREIARVTAPAMSEELYNLNKRKTW